MQEACKQTPRLQGAGGYGKEGTSTVAWAGQNPFPEAASPFLRPMDADVSSPLPRDKMTMTLSFVKENNSSIVINARTLQS